MATWLKGICELENSENSYPLYNACTFILIYFMIYPPLHVIWSTCTALKILGTPSLGATRCKEALMSKDCSSNYNNIIQWLRHAWEGCSYIHNVLVGQDFKLNRRAAGGRRVATKTACRMKQGFSPIPCSEDHTSAPIAFCWDRARLVWRAGQVRRAAGGRVMGKNLNRASLFWWGLPVAISPWMQKQYVQIENIRFS